jgi:hypothetical protein
MKQWTGLMLGCGLVTVCSLVGLGDSTARAGASKQTPASELLLESITDATNAGWVHEVTVNAGDAHRVSMVDDIGTSSGRQVIDDNGGHLTVVITGGVAYVQGDAKALARDLGAPSHDAVQLAGQWLSIPPTFPAFGSVSAAVTLKSDFRATRLTGSLTTGKVVRIGGTPAIPITGLFPGAPHHERITATLYVSAAGQPLPLEYRASQGGITHQTRWTDWGRPVLLSAPSDAISLTSGGSAAP